MLWSGPLARLVVNARSSEALSELLHDLKARGAHAQAVRGDVASAADMRRLASRAEEAFGRIDTWVNNAGISIYGRLEEVTEADHRRLFETNFWGVVNGSLAALPALKESRGCLVNIGSTLSDRAFPIQGMYSASKHAVAGYTDALRMELMDDDAGVSVSLIKPAAVDTPYTEHAKSYVEGSPRNPPPYYQPESVARAVLRCAESGERELYVGSAGRLIAAMGDHAPGISDRLMGAAGPKLESRGRPDPEDRTDSLYEPGRDGETRSYKNALTIPGVRTKPGLTPITAGALLLGGLAMGSLISAARD